MCLCTRIVLVRAAYRHVPYAVWPGGGACHHRDTGAACRMDNLHPYQGTRLAKGISGSTSTRPFPLSGGNVTHQKRQAMIKCNVTLCGTISRDASVRTGKDGKEFVSFPLQVSIPGKNGNDGNMEVSVSKDGGQDTVHEYRYGSRAKVTGTLLLKRRGEKLYFNLSADSVDLSDAGNTDSVKGQMVFRGKTGKHIEERKDKTGKPYLMFSAFSTEKVNDGFEYQWVRFFCFGKEKEEWLQPGVKVDAKGEMSLSLYDGKPDISCRVEELNQYVPEAGNDNR